MHLSILHKLPLVNLSLHGLDGAKIIMHSILLALARLSRGVADAESEFIIGEVLLEEFDEGTLACDMNSIATLEM